VKRCGEAAESAHAEKAKSDAEKSWFDKAPRIIEMETRIDERDGTIRLLNRRCRALDRQTCSTRRLISGPPQSGR
jgi:hypothetical protein